MMGLVRLSSNGVYPGSIPVPTRGVMPFVHGWILEDEGIPMSFLMMITTTMTLRRYSLVS